MVIQNSLSYRQPITLPEGTRVLLRPLTHEDREALIAFYADVGPDELIYFRSNVHDTQLVGSWVDELDYDKVFPLLAVVGDRIVGNTTLYFNQGYKRHIAEVRIYLAKEFRQRSLGTRMLQGLIDIARRRSLLMLEVHVIHDQTNIIRAFHNAGFVTKYILEDGYMLPDGELRDVDYMVKWLRSINEEF
jgi:L-amino acid N-acyltransferase YncA